MGRKKRVLFYQDQHDQQSDIRHILLERLDTKIQKIDNLSFFNENDPGVCKEGFRCV